MADLQSIRLSSTSREMVDRLNGNFTELENRKVDNELKTGSESEYKELTDNNLTDTLKSNYDSAYTDKHTHSNKTLLDTYTQTEANIADAVSKKHEHSNKAILDNITSAFTSEQATRLSGIETGAQVNIIEGVKRNGVLLTPTSKIVDVTVPTKISDLTDDTDSVTPIKRATADASGNTITTTYQTKSNLRTSFQATPDDTHYISEKLAKDSLDAKASRVADPTTNNLAKLTATGDLADSGKALSDFVLKTDVIDNLTSTYTDKPLSAKQGKTLKDLVDNLPKAKNYETIEAMITALNAMNNTTLIPNLDININALEVPDFWVFSVESSSVPYTYTTDDAFVLAVKTAPVQVGYYKLSLKETEKVDLTDYLSKTNTTEYTPTANYHPATKKYVDDAISGFSVLESITFTDASEDWSGLVDGYYTLAITSDKTPVSNAKKLISGTLYKDVLAEVGHDGTNIYIVTDTKFTGMILVS